MTHLKSTSVQIRNLNPNFLCKLCNGYFIEPYTINECLHTFCKACIIKHLNNDDENGTGVNECPVCFTRLHPVYPMENIMPDRLLEDIIDKTMPSLYLNEIDREKLFWKRKNTRIPAKSLNKIKAKKRRIDEVIDSIKESRRKKFNEINDAITLDNCYLHVQLKLLSIDSNFENCKQLFYTHLCAPVLNSTAFDVKEFLSKQMNVNRDYEVVLVIDQYELRDDCPLLLIKNRYFYDEEFLIINYAICQKQIID